MSSPLTTGISTALATGLGSGFLPKSPGTAGTVVFVALWVLASIIFGFPSTQTSILIAVVTCVVGILTSRIYMRELTKRGISDQKDPQQIVIDEWAGMSITLIGANSGHWLEILLAFVLFRLFDITKPPPVNYLERLPGEWGVMMDDVAAGLIAAALLYWLSPLIIA